MIKALAYIPYHDWRKIVAEGNRTRDAHFIDSFRKNKQLNKLIIVNRPITFLELIVKKRKLNFKLNGEVVFEKSNGKLYKIDEQTFVLDFVMNQSLKQMIKGRSWFFMSYQDKQFKHFYYECINYLDCEYLPVISANIFAYRFFESIKGKKLFDAWDNFYLMPGMKSIKKELFEAYLSYSKSTKKWFTNSTENISFYKRNYNVSDIELLTNGVGKGVFNQKNSIPDDLKKIKNKGNILAGFGGKITHLFDSEIFNYITANNPKINFIIIGQVLDKKEFKKIVIRENVYYLGDKHYGVYPNYITNLDIGIIPYRIKDKQHGGDSIKAYEYLASGLKVVGTNGNGLQNLEEYIHIANTKEEFNEMLKMSNEKETFEIENFSWENKSFKLLEEINALN